jgi:hypothetical protein
MYYILAFGAGGSRHSRKIRKTQRGALLAYLPRSKSFLVLIAASKSHAPWTRHNPIICTIKRLRLEVMGVAGIWTWRACHTCSKTLSDRVMTHQQLENGVAVDGHL